MPRLKFAHEDIQPQMGDPWTAILALGEHLPQSSALTRQLLECILAEGELSPRLGELIRIRIGFHNQCRTCMAVRYQPDVVTESLVCSLEKPADAADLSAAEKAALRYADLFAMDHLTIDERVYDELRQHFDEKELVQLGMLCAYCVGFGRMMATWAIVEQLPESFRKDGIVTPWGHDEVLIPHG